MTVGKRSQGSQLLARTGKSQQAIADDVGGVSRVAVQQWLSGDKKPGKANRARVRELYGVPEEAWDQAPARAARSSATSPKPAAATREDALAVGGPFAMARELEDMAREQIATLRADTESNALERARVMSSIASTLNALARLTGDYDLGRRLTKLPLWRRLETELASALRPYPDAAKAVADRFRALDAGGFNQT